MSGARVTGLSGGSLASARQVKQARFATAVALTRTAKDIEAAAVARMKQVLSDPRPYTLRALAVRPATKASLRAETFFREFAGKGVAAGKYLRALEFGGVRRFKKFERALQRSGVIEPFEFAIPADGGSIDLRGSANVGGVYNRILSGLRANPDPLSNTPSLERGRRGVRKARSRAKFFRSGRFIWERLSRSNVRPVLVIVTRAPTYSPILGFGRLADETARRWMPVRYAEAMRQAQATAR